VKSILLAGFMTCCTLGALPRSAQAQGAGPFSSFTQFSATLVEHDSDNTTNTAKLYRLSNKMRSEQGPEGHVTYFLSLLGQNTGFLVGSGLCMETHGIDPEHPNPFEVTGKIVRKELGSEVIDGHPTKIEQITVASASGKALTMKAWEATDLKSFPVRIEMATPKGTMRMDLKDVDLSAPPASLFATPQGCSPMPNASGKQD
jgi:Domain of unknown function (DUF4412)